MKNLMHPMVLIYVMSVATIRAKLLEDTAIQPLGPQPFTKDVALKLDISPPDEYSKTATYDEADLIQNIDNDLPKYRNVDDPSSTLNLTLNLLPSFNNDTSNVFLNAGDTESTVVPEQPSIVKKPSGTLYVDSVHNFQRSPTQRRMGGMPGCKMDEDLDDNDDEDPHQLSASQFGFPKSIVNKALEDSPFKSVLSLLARLQNVYRSRKEQSDTGGNRNVDQIVESEKRFGPFSEFVSTSSLSNTYTNNDDTPGELQDSDGSYRTFNTYFNGDTMLRHGDSGKSPFFPPSQYKNDFSSFQASDDSADRFSPQLLEGSVFASTVNSNNNVQVDNENNMGNDNNDNGKTNEKPSNYDDKSIMTNSSPQSQNTENGGTQFNLGVNNNQTPNNQNLYSKYLPDVSGADSWTVSSNEGYSSYKDFSSQRSLPYQQGNNKLSGMMKSLFPPKKSESLPEISGLNDLIPKTNPVIQHSDKQKSNVDSPFEIDIDSLLGSIPGSNLVGNGQPKHSTSSSSGSGVLNKFDLFSSGITNKVKPPLTSTFNGGSSNIAGMTSGTTDHNEIRFAEYRTRRKRETSGSQPDTRDSCKGTYNNLHQYQNHGGACFVVLPEVQGVQFATCPQSSCSGCAVNGGASRCRAVRVPIWVWAYCESGPSAGTVAPDRVNVSVACTCKISYCRQIPLGRS